MAAANFNSLNSPPDKVASVSFSPFGVGGVGDKGRRKNNEQFKLSTHTQQQNALQDLISNTPK
jgi:hypothetical protein